MRHSTGGTRKIPRSVWTLDVGFFLRLREHLRIVDRGHMGIQQGLLTESTMLGMDDCDHCLLLEWSRAVLSSRAFYNDGNVLYYLIHLTQWSLATCVY